MLENFFGQGNCGCNDAKPCFDNCGGPCNLKIGGTGSCKVLIYLVILYVILNCGILNCGFDICTLLILLMFICCFCKKGYKHGC